MADAHIPGIVYELSEDDLLGVSGDVPIKTRKCSCCNCTYKEYCMEQFQPSLKLTDQSFVLIT
jgi:hypothetical protein